MVGARSSMPLALGTLLRLHHVPIQLRGLVPCFLAGLSSSELGSVLQ